MCSEYDLASREMSLVAVVERTDDKAGGIPKMVVVPVGMPQDVEFGSYFRTRGHARMARYSAAPMYCVDVCDPIQFEIAESPRAIPMPPEPGILFQSVSQDQEDTGVDLLMDLAAAIEPDGGMPGGSPEARVLVSMITLLLFTRGGSTQGSGPFRSHIRRLISFLNENTAKLDNKDHTSILNELIQNIESIKNHDKRLDRLARAIAKNRSVPNDKIWRVIKTYC